MTNTIILIGNLAKDPVALTGSKSGAKIAACRLAVDDYRNGERLAYYFDVLAFAKTAENVLAICKKGHKLAVTGKLTQRKYTAKDGSEKIATEILADRIDILTPKAKDEKTADDKGEDVPF